MIEGWGTGVAWVLFALWVSAASAAGAGLAWFARRLRPGYSFRRLWVLYSGISAVLAAFLYTLWFT